MLCPTCHKPKHNHRELCPDFRHWDLNFYYDKNKEYYGTEEPEDNGEQPVPRN